MISLVHGNSDFLMEIFILFPYLAELWFPRIVRPFGDQGRSITTNGVNGTILLFDHQKWIILY